MQAMHVTLMPTPDPDTAAAVMAAIACVIATEATEDMLDTPTRSAWRTAAVAAAQGLPPARNGAFAGWHTAERARRAERWSSGITGL